jgi:hypothetical protein
MAYPRQDKNVDPLPIMDDGDLAFSGMDMRAPPLVQPGFASSAKNMRIEDGVYWPRKGLFTPTWTRYASDDFPYRASYLRNDAAAWTASYATTYGACIYSDPADGGETWIVRVCASSLLFFRETEIGRIIPFASGLTVSGPVIVFQNFNKLIICRGGSESSLVWSGSFSDAVSELVPSSIASGFAAVPVADYGLAWRERTVLLSGRDTLILSRIADSTQYNETSGIYYVNRGVGDTLRAAVPIGAFSLLILKSQSLHVFSATIADLSDARLDPQAVEMRFDSPKTAVAADNKIWWLDRRGIRTAEVIQVDGDNKVRLQVDSTVSDKIRPLINRINWQYASLFSAAVTTDRIYFAVALDTQTTPQTLLVWNRVFNAWESYDQWSVTFNVQSLVSGYEWLKEPRIFGVSNAGSIAALNTGLGEDHVGWTGDVATKSPILQGFVSRGYTCGDNDTKLFKLAKIQADTWNPGTLAISAVFDGPEENSSLSGITRARAKYFTGIPDFVVNNTNDDFNDARRQDYSILLGPIPASGNSAWAAGTTYNYDGPDYANSEVYVASNGHNYQALITAVAVAPNRPDLDSLTWLDLGTDTPPDAALDWEVGENYPVSTIVRYESSIDVRYYACLITNTGTLGNGPLYDSDYWLDLGLDSGATLGSIYLHDGIAIEEFQQTTDRKTINREAVWCQVSVTNSQGAFKVRSMAVEAQPGNRTNSYHS